MVNPEDIHAARYALGQQLATYRRDAGLSQVELAPVVHYSRSTVANAETGRQLVTKKFWERADRAVHAHGTLVDSYEQVRALIEQRRREVAAVSEAERAERFRQAARSVRAIVAAATSRDTSQENPTPFPVSAVKQEPDGPVEPWTRLAHALTHPGRVDERAVEYLEHATGEFFRRTDDDPTGGLAADPLRAHIQRVQHLLDGTPRRHRRRLLSILGESWALAGWVAWHAMDTSGADEAYQQAEQIARQAGDLPLIACVLIYRSHLAEALGQVATAGRLVAEAQRLLPERHHAATRSWAAAREAEITALLGDHLTALTALQRAIVTYDYVRPHHERHWTHAITPGLLAAATVTTYARLDHPDLDTTVQKALTALARIDPSRTVMVLADAATTAIRRGEYEHATRLGAQALDAATGRTNRLITERLHHLHAAVKDADDMPALAALHDRLISHTP